MRMKVTLPWGGIAASLLATQPVLAERVHTFWRLEPVVKEPPRTVQFGEPFLEQRLLPVKLVALTEPASVGKRTLPTGTFLYLVFNADRKIAYCTIKDRSVANQARTLFIPIADQRPCLFDSDSDGRFDKVFYVFDKHGGPPSVRGSINGAKPMTRTAAYRETDVHEFPGDLRINFIFGGKRDMSNSRIGIAFSRSLGAWGSFGGTTSEGGVTFSVLNAEVRLVSISGEVAQIETRWDEAMYLSSDNDNTLYWSHLPEFVPRGGTTFQP